MKKFNTEIKMILQEMVNKEQAKWDDKYQMVKATRLAEDSQVRERREQLAEEKRLRRLREDEEERRQYELEDSRVEMERSQQDDELMQSQQEAC